MAKARFEVRRGKSDAVPFLLWDHNGFVGRSRFAYDAAWQGFVVTNFVMTGTRTFLTIADLRQAVGDDVAAEMLYVMPFRAGL